MEELIVPVFVVGVVVGLPILCITIIILAKIIKGGDRKTKNLASSEEMQILHTIHDGLERLERRIEALETITADRRSAHSNKSNNL